MARDDVQFQSAEQRGESSAAAESDDANAASRRNFWANVFCHDRARARAGDFTLAEKWDGDDKGRGSGENGASEIYRAAIQYQ